MSWFDVIREISQRRLPGGGVASIDGSDFDSDRDSDMSPAGGTDSDTPSFGLSRMPVDTASPVGPTRIPWYQPKTGGAAVPLPDTGGYDIPPQVPDTPESPRSALDRAMQDVYRLQNIRSKDDLLNVYDQHKDSTGMNIGKGLLMALKNISPVMMDPRIPDKMALGYALGGAFGGVANGILNPAGDEYAQYQQDMGKAMGNLKQAQGMYDTDVKGRGDEAGIDATKAMTDKRYADIQHGMDQVQIGKRKNDLKEGDLIQDQWEKAPVWDPNGAVQKSISDRYQAITGVPLARKDATVKKVENLPDAAAKRLWRSLTYIDGRTEAGWVKPDGTLTANKAEGAEYTDPRTESARIETAGHITTTGMRTAADIKQTEMKLDNDMTKFRAKTKEERDQLITGLEVMLQQGQVTQEYVEKKRAEILANNPFQ